MAPLYEPLREGFREMNRMLTDRQVFNEQNKAREASRDREEIMLASQLEDRAFNKAMSTKSFDLRQEQAEHDIASSDRSWKRLETQDIHARKREGILDQRYTEDKKIEEDTRKVNKAHRDKMYDLHKQSADTKDEMQKLAIEETKANKALKANQRQIVLDSTDRILEKKTPVPIASSIERLGILNDEDWMSDPDNVQNLVDIFDANSYDPEKGFLDINNIPLKLAPNEIYQMKDVIQSTYDDGRAIMPKLVGDFKGKQREIMEKSKEISQYGITSRHAFDQVHEAKLKVERSTLQREANEIRESMAPEAQLERLQKWRATAERAASWHGEFGNETDKALSLKKLSNYDSQIKQIFKSKETKFKGQKIGVIRDPETGTIIRQGYFNIPTNAQGITPGELNPAFRNKNASWLEVSSAEAKLRPKGMSVAAWNSIDRQLNTQYADTVFADGFSMEPELGAVRDMTKAVASFIHQYSPGQFDQATLPVEATRQFGMLSEQYFGKADDLKARVESGRITQATYEAEVEELQESTEKVFGGRLPTLRTMETYNNWLTAKGVMDEGG